MTSPGAASQHPKLPGPDASRAEQHAELGRSTELRRAASSAQAATNGKLLTTAAAGLSIDAAALTAAAADGHDAMVEVAYGAWKAGDPGAGGKHTQTGGTS